MRAEDESITVDAVARIVCNAQRDLGYWLEDPHPSAPYDTLPEEQRIPVQSLVRLIAQGYSADYVQDMWVTSMLEKGWKHGPAKDPSMKTHPCMVKFGELPFWERRKVHLAFDIVEGFARFLDLSLLRETAGILYDSRYACCYPRSCRDSFQAERLSYPCPDAE